MTAGKLHAYFFRGTQTVVDDFHLYFGGLGILVMAWDKVSRASVSFRVCLELGF